MAKKTSRKIHINLGSKGKQTVGKLMYGWTIDAGRAIIIGIELIALLALGYRFVIDRKIVNLNDEIKREELYIAAQANEEKTYRSIQKRLESIKLITNETSAKVTVMNEILEVISSGLFFSTNLSINNQEVSIEGSTFSASNLTDFINQISELPEVSTISIGEISTSDEGVRFKASITINNSVQSTTESTTP